ncbi:MAG: S-layer homology domain-containing protein [Clostridia bacterium]|nr:S-layer homology domain-containing protein [Clostridia bacterium]
MKKKVLCVAFMIFSMCANAFAATDVSVTDNKVKVEADASPGEWGTLIVTRSGKSLDDENIIAIKQAVADQDGIVTFNFTMPAVLEGGVNGKYDLHIKNGDENIYTESIYYASPADRSSVAGELKSNTDIKTVLEKEGNENTLKALGVSLDIYNKLKETDAKNNNTELTDAISKAFTAARSDGMSDEEAASLLNEILIMQAINTFSDNGVENIEKLGLSFDNTKYKDANDSAKKFVCDYIYANKPYSNVSDIKKAYLTANILNVINTTRFDSMEAVLKKYAESLGITKETAYTSYLKLTNKVSVNESIATSLNKKPVSAVKDLLSVIDTAIKANANSTKPSSSGGGGGGGGGGVSTVKPTSNGSTTFPVVTYESGIEDIDEVPWAKDAIFYLAQKGIISGDENHKFHPNNSVKREEFVKMLVMAAGMYRDDASCNFTDVNSGAWYYSYVASAYKSHLVYGGDQNRFGVGENITRQDMAVMCHRMAGTVNKLNKVRQRIEFADYDKISDYAKEAVDELYEAGIISGVGENFFDSMGTATRAQAAVMIYNLFVH